jgi:AcrR family transcriptional regulator
MGTRIARFNVVRTRSKQKGRRSAALVTHSAEATQDNILAVATSEFAEKGLAGARIDEIAEKTQTSKRMIYYHFGSKEGLYQAVLEQEYGRIRDSEISSEIEELPAKKALAQLVRLTFDYHQDHPEFVRLVMNENIHHAEYLAEVNGIQERNESVIAALSSILARGEREGVFRKAIDPIDLHMSITALCFYNVSNRHTFLKIFGRDMSLPKVAAKRREQIVEIISGWCETR